MYANFRNRYWKPALEAVGLPHVAPHSARHAFISTLQAKGVEVGLVAKLAGHANAAITLSHYTQAVRVGQLRSKRWSKPTRAEANVGQHQTSHPRRTVFTSELSRP